MNAPLWDIPTRITHWALALCVILNLFVVDEGEDPHHWIGYTAVGLVGFRFLWGFFGKRPSRLKSLPIHPRTVWAYVRGGMKEGDAFAQKHNPLASYVYLTLWLLVIGLGISGWMMGLDAFWGEEWLEEVHGYLSTGVQVMVVAHLLGIAFDSIRYRRHTWLAMITGRRDQKFRSSEKKSDRL